MTDWTKPCLKIAAMLCIVGGLLFLAGSLKAAWPTIHDIWSRVDDFGKVSIVGVVLMAVGILIFVVVSPPHNRPTVKPPKKWGELDD